MEGRASSPVQPGEDARLSMKFCCYFFTGFFLVVP
jgi:hypothetical protein